jgi:hypothetical protein
MLRHPPWCKAEREEARMTDRFRVSIVALLSLGAFLPSRP